MVSTLASACSATWRSCTSATNRSHTPPMKVINVSDRVYTVGSLILHPGSKTLIPVELEELVSTIVTKFAPELELMEVEPAKPDTRDAELVSLRSELEALKAPKAAKESVKQSKKLAQDSEIL